MSHGMYKWSSPHRRTQADYPQHQLQLTGFHAASQHTSRTTSVATASLYRGNAVQSELYPREPECLDLANPFIGVLQVTKMNEKELLHGLNDRFAGFIEKVRHLEHQNQLLEREIADIRQKAQSPSTVAQEYEPELKHLRKLVEDITIQKRQIEIEHDNLEDDVLILREKCDKDAQNRSDAENSIVVLKKDISDAYLAKLQLDKKAQSLVDEIHFLKEHHEAEVSEMVAQIQKTQVKVVEAHDFGKPDLTAALRDIRAQLEGHAVSDIQQADECFRAQFARLTKAAEINREALKVTTLEIQENRRRLQGKNIELDCANGTREGLERQLRELEERHDKEIIHYQDAIKQLENELINTKFDMSGYLREYQDLLNVKMALDVEILSYRKLLEGEETHLSSISDTHISMPYIYRQSPVYTLPCLARQGGPTRRAEPQYKFVEEIITETIREVEMSGSEGGEGEEEAVEAECRSSEEEDLTPEEEGEQATEGQKVQTSSQDMDGGHAGGAGEREEAEEEEQGKGEVDEIAATDQNKLNDSNQEPESVVEVQEAALPVSSEEERKPADVTGELKSRLTKETAEPVTSSEGDKAQAMTPELVEKVPATPEKEVSPAKELSSPELRSLTKEAAEPVMSSEGDKAQEMTSETPGRVEKVPATPEKEVSPAKELSSPELRSLTKETAEPVMSSEGDKAQGMTPERVEKVPATPEKEVSPAKDKVNSPELRSSLTKETAEPVMSSEGDKAQEMTSETPERVEKVPATPEKEVSPAKEKVNSPEETVKTGMSETSPKPDVNDKTSSGEGAKTGSGKSEEPKKQAAAVVENKDLHKGAPESTATKSEQVKEPEKITDPKLTLETESSKTITEGSKEGKSEHVEVTIPKKAAEVQHGLSVKEKMQTQSAENGLTEGNGAEKGGKVDAKLSKSRVEPVQEKKA